MATYLSAGRPAAPSSGNLGTASPSSSSSSASGRSARAVPKPAVPSKPHRTPIRLWHDILAHTCLILLRWSTFLRSVGLHTLAFIGYSGQEQPKVVLSSSASYAFAACAVHIIPVSAELVIIGLNLYGILYGDGTAVQLATMQGVAKIMELLAVGSLTTIVVAVLRHHLLLDTGVPFGFLGAGVSFTQINWFWSPGFLLSIQSNRRQVFLAATLVTCGILAVAVGPAAAVLLVPVLRNDWYGGGTTFWMNGSVDTLWPTNLTVDHIGGRHCQENTSVASRAVDFIDLMGDCAWHGYSVNSFGTIFVNGFTQGRANNGHLRLPSYVKDGQTLTIPCETTVYAPRNIEKQMATRLEELWYNAVHGEPNLKTRFLPFAFPYTGYTRTKIGAVRTRCGLDVINSTDDVVELSFPILPEYDHFDGDYWKMNVTFAGSDVNSSHSMSRWVDLNGARSSSGSSTQPLPSAALIVSLGAYSKLKKLKRIFILSCSIDAGWADGYNSRQVSLPKNAWQPVYQPYYGSPGNLPISGSCGEPWPPVANDSWRRITIDQSYLRWMTLSLEGGPSSDSEMQRTTLTDVLDASTDAISRARYTSLDSIEAVKAEVIIAQFFADALARVGWGDNLQLWKDMGDVVTSVASTLKSKTALLNNGTVFTKPKYKHTVETTWEIRNTGYALDASSPTTYMAIAVFLVHMAVAIAHTIYVLWYRKTSFAWDSIEEILALTWNSEPSRGARKNTATGINDRKTLSGMVRIGVVTASAGVATEEIQLVAVTEPPGTVGRVQVGKAYGSS